MRVMTWIWLNSMADSFPWSIIIPGGVIGAGEECFARSFVSFERVAGDVSHLPLSMMSRQYSPPFK